VKMPRTERSVDDFSSVVKNKLQGHTRTGQACDRCKVRAPLRCDVPIHLGRMLTRPMAGPQDQMRWRARRLLPLQESQHRVQSHGPRHRPHRGQRIHTPAGTPARRDAGSYSRAREAPPEPGRRV
jgi:hypothetical protein